MADASLPYLTLPYSTAFMLVDPVQHCFVYAMCDFCVCMLQKNHLGSDKTKTLRSGLRVIVIKICRERTVILGDCW